MTIGIRYKKIQIGTEPFIAFKDGIVAAKEVLAIKQDYSWADAPLGDPAGHWEPIDGKVYVTFKAHGSDVVEVNRNQFFSCDPTHPLMGE